MLLIFSPFFGFLLVFSLCGQAIAKFLALMYSYLNISMSRNIVPDEIKGREIHHSFPMTLFLVGFCSLLLIAFCEKFVYRHLKLISIIVRRARRLNFSSILGHTIVKFPPINICSSIL